MIRGPVLGRACCKHVQSWGPAHVLHELHCMTVQATHHNKVCQASRCTTTVIIQVAWQAWLHSSAGVGGRVRKRDSGGAWGLQVVSESLDVPESSTAPSGSMLPPAISATSLLEAPPPPVSMAASPSPRPPTPPAEPLIAGSPFGHHSMQNRPDSHPPPAAQAAGDALGQPKASGDRWDYQLPLASPFSSQPGLAFPQPAAPKRAALAEPEPGRVSREDIAALASGSPAAQGHDADAHTIESKHPQRPAAHQSDATPPVGEDAVGSSSLI